MLVMANNITTKNARINRAFRELRKSGWSAGQPVKGALQELTQHCTSAGADILELNLPQYRDEPEAMQFAVTAIQQVTDRQLCLSADNVATLEAGLRTCRRPPLVNYVSSEDTRLQRILPLIAEYGAEVVLLITGPRLAPKMLKKAITLVDAANKMGITNSRLFIDPGIYHITSYEGQRHLSQVMEFLRALPLALDPPLRSICWISNVSAGAPRRLRPVIETTCLAMLYALGLSSVCLDVLKRDNMRTVRLLKILNNKAVYSDRDIKL